MSTPTKWKCDVCGERFYTKGEADACEREPETPPSAKVGDIVLCGAGFGWFDGDKAWVENYAEIGDFARGRKCPSGDGNCFSACCTYQFFYVIVAIGFTAGRWLYQLRTNAMTGKSGYEQKRSSWCVRAKRVPKFVRKDAQRLALQATNVENP